RYFHVTGVQTCALPICGNTGLVGGAIAPADRPAVLLNVSRMNRVRHVDANNNSLTVEAGCILANVREVADEHQRQFPMLLGSVEIGRASCRESVYIRVG